jgi:hypothetical protein
MKQYRNMFLLFMIAAIPNIGLWAQSRSLKVEMNEDSLKVSAHRLRFLTDWALARLHNGLTVTLVMNLTVVAKQAEDPLYHAQERFAFSFDLWEEKYSVFRSPPNGRSISHLSAASAEAWCLNNMPIPLEVIPEQQSFMIQLDCSIEESGNGKQPEDEPGLSIGGLIKYLSRKESEEPHYWKTSTGQLRLSDLKQPERNDVRD